MKKEENMTPLGSRVGKKHRRILRSLARKFGASQAEVVRLLIEKAGVEALN